MWEAEKFQHRKLFQRDQNQYQMITKEETQIREAIILPAGETCVKMSSGMTSPGSTRLWIERIVEHEIMFNLYRNENHSLKELRGNWYFPFQILCYVHTAHLMCSEAACRHRGFLAFGVRCSGAIAGSYGGTGKENCVREYRRGLLRIFCW